MQPIIQAICAPISGRLADKYTPAKIATIGMGFCAAGLSIATFLHADSPFYLIFIILILLGLGFGIFSAPNTTAIMSSIHLRDYGMASSMTATMRSVGMLMSMTIITIILSLFLFLGNKPVTIQTTQAFIRSMHITLIIFSIMRVVGIGFSFGRFAPADLNKNLV